MRCARARLLASLTIAAALASPAALVSQSPAADIFAISRGDRIKVFDRLWKQVHEEYFDPQFNGVNWSAMRDVYRPRVEAARNKLELHDTLRQMLGELDSSHLSVNLRVTIGRELVRESLSRPLTRWDRVFINAGAQLTRLDGRAIVESVAAGSGAATAGVQRGWTLTHWNREPFRNTLYRECALGETLDLQFLDLEGRETTREVTCQLYTAPRRPPTRTARLIDGGAILLRFGTFSTGADRWLASHVAAHPKAPAVIVDLRGNSGGLLTVLQRSLDPFFGERTIIGSFRRRHGEPSQLDVDGRGKRAYTGKVIVMIDETSASAAEIFAAALQEAGRGTVVGRRSGGLVLNSRQFPLQNGFAVSIAVADYRTARGTRLEGVGVQPDETVPFTLTDLVANRDRDFERVSRMLLNMDGYKGRMASTRPASVKE